MTALALLKTACKKNRAVYSLLTRSYLRTMLLLGRVQRRTLRKRLLSLYGDSTDAEIGEIVSFLKSRDVQMIPYDFVGEYQADVSVLHDAAHDLPYVVVAKDRVYFPREMHPSEIAAAVRAALMEQDPRSPHRYLADDFTLEDEGAAVFIGASDGIYCLTVLDRFKKIYLFEADPAWQEPLQRTFAPWGEKVRVIQTCVSDLDSSATVSLDTFCAGIEDEITYIQADIEGFEGKMISGAARLIKESPRLKLSLCTYHRHDDARDFTEVLTAAGMRVWHSKGYMIMWQQVPLERPYLRRGVMYAEKSCRGRA